MQSQVPQQYVDYKHVTAWWPGNSPASLVTRTKAYSTAAKSRQIWVLAKRACTYQLLLRHAAARGGRQRFSDSAATSSTWKSISSSLALNCLVQAAGYMYEACMTKARMTRPIRSNSHEGSYTPVRSISARSLAVQHTGTRRAGCTLRQTHTAQTAAACSSQ